MLSALLYACTIASVYAVFLAFTPAEPEEDRMQILDHPDITEAAKQLFESGDVRAGLTAFINAGVRVLLESHKAADAQGQRDAWRRQLIEDGRDKVDVLLIMFPRIKDPKIQSDLLYCLQEITGVPLDHQPDLPLDADSLKAGFVKLKRQLKAAKGNVAPKPKRPPTELIGTWIGPVERDAVSGTVQRELRFENDLYVTVTTHILDDTGRPESSSATYGSYEIDGNQMIAGALGTRDPIRVDIDGDVLTIQFEGTPAIRWTRRTTE